MVEKGLYKYRTMNAAQYNLFLEFVCGSKNVMSHLCSFISELESRNWMVHHGILLHYYLYMFQILLFLIL